MNLDDYVNRRYKDRITGTVYVVKSVDKLQGLLNLESASGNTRTQQVATDMIYTWERVF